MPTLQKVKDDATAELDGLMALLSARQENYRTNRGIYWQGLRTHSSSPAYTNATGGATIGDRLAIAPDDDPFNSWLVVFPEWATLPLVACLRVDTYDGPNGKGWVVIQEFAHSDGTYMRAVNVGPESDRSYPWTLQVDPI